MKKVKRSAHDLPQLHPNLEEALILTTMIASEEDRLGDGDVTDTEGMEEGVANDSMASTPIILWIG